MGIIQTFWFLLLLISNKYIIQRSKIDYTAIWMYQAIIENVLLKIRRMMYSDIINFLLNISMNMDDNHLMNKFILEKGIPTVIQVVFA